MIPLGLLGNQTNQVKLLDEVKPDLTGITEQQYRYIYSRGYNEALTKFYFPLWETYNYLENNHQNIIAQIKITSQLEIDSIKLKSSMKRTGLFWTGFFIGIGTSIGTGIVINSFDFPLIKFSF